MPVHVCSGASIVCWPVFGIFINPWKLAKLGAAARASKKTLLYSFFPGS
jgi:hypothetical protein